MSSLTESTDHPLNKQTLLGVTSVDGVEQQCALGADPNAQDARGQTPLHTATGPNVSDVMQALITAGAHVDIADNTGRQPLHEVADLGSMDADPRERERCIDVLIEAGADPYARDHQGRTPALTVNDYFRIRERFGESKFPFPMSPSKHTSLGALLDLRSPPAMSSETRSHKRSR